MASQAGEYSSNVAQQARDVATKAAEKVGDVATRLTGGNGSGKEGQGKSTIPVSMPAAPAESQSLSGLTPQ